MMILNKLTFPLVSLMTVLLFAFVSNIVEAAPPVFHTSATDTAPITTGAFTAYQGDDQAGIRLYPHDADGDKITLNIESKPDAIGEFSISQDIVGVTILFLKNVPTNAPVEDDHMVTVQAKSDGESATLTVTVTVKARPRFDTSIDNNQVFIKGVEIDPITLPAATHDGMGTLPASSYALTPDLPADLDFNAGTRMLRGTPDAVLPETRFTYTAKNPDLPDDRTKDGTLTFTITVVENNAPVFDDDGPTTRFVVENTPSGRNIKNPLTGTDAPITATDEDGDTLTYTLGDTADDSAFHIVSTSGQLQTRAPLDLETKAYYLLTVTVSDGKGGTDSITVDIVVTENIPPVFTEGTSTRRRVAENTATNTNIGDPITATDVDRGMLIYTLGDTADDSAFRIVSTSGQLQTRAPLDFETKAYYLLTVTVSDDNGGTASIPVDIVVTDVRERVPQPPPEESQPPVIQPVEPPPDDTQQPTPEETEEETQPATPVDPPATNNPGSGGGGGGGGTPRRDTVTATKVPYSPIVINEIGNNEGNAHDWVELLNVTDTEVDLQNWELTQIVSENSETALVAFPDGKGAHTIPAQGVLLLVGSDPFQDTEHPLAAGIKINADTSSARREKKTGIRSRYYVDARLQLSDTEPSLLVLRNAKNKKRTSENIVDLTGSLYIEDASTDFQTQLWPLQATQAGSDDVLRELDEAFVAGKVYQRRKIKSGTAEHTWGSRWYTGVGYKRTAKQVAANGGTPGFPNDAVKAQISDLVENATVSISEIMYTPGRGMPQWIELYNSATTQAVNLKDWELQLESAAGADVRNITLTLKANILIQPNQPLLLVSAKTESDQHSGHFPPSRLINLWGLYRSELEVIDVGRQYTLLSPNAFRLTLREKGGGVVDVAGNLGDAGQARWALPTAEAGRSSILRVYDKTTGPRDGTLGVAGTAKTYGWILAADRAALAPQPLYYGHRDDQGSPGYRIGGALPVSLSLFSSQRVDSGAVVVKWVTESELNNAGFNILRSETREGVFERVNASLIAGQGTTSERTVYTWTDSTAKPEVFYYYQIEEVSLAGERLPLATARLRGHISAAGKLTTRWGALKQPLH